MEIRKLVHTFVCTFLLTLNFRTMSRLNILNKEGFLTEEDRKESFYHHGDYLQFSSCLDLSNPIKVMAFGIAKEISVEVYSREVASFISWWTHFVWKDLNGFSGFYHVKFELVGFKVV